MVGSALLPTNRVNHVVVILEQSGSVKYIEQKGKSVNVLELQMGELSGIVDRPFRNRYVIDGQEFDLADKPSNPKDIIGSNKLPLGLVPATTQCYLALGHSEGHLKYGLVNWREAGVRFSIYKDALLRHLVKFEAGEEEDPETQVPHLANAITCLSIIIDAKECGKLIDDRPKAAPVTGLIERFSKKLMFLKKLFGDKKPVDYFLCGAKQRE